MVNNSMISTKHNHFSPKLVEHKKTTTYDLGNQGPLGQAWNCGGVKLFKCMNYFVIYTLWSIRDQSYGTILMLVHSAFCVRKVYRY
jgi:hypothetical protein